MNVSGADIGIDLRVKEAAGGANGIPAIALAGLLDDCIGVTRTPVPNNGRGVVNLENSGGVLRGVASKAIAARAKVYQDANGQLTDTSAGAGDNKLVGIAETAASGAGDHFNYMPIQAQTAP
jgi:hypothetical protein